MLAFLLGAGSSLACPRLCRKEAATASGHGLGSSSVCPGVRLRTVCRASTQKALPHPSAVGSLRDDAGDLATLLIELVEPRHLSPGTARQMSRPQIPAGEGFSWGLGIGIQHSAQGDALWQNAQTFGYRGLWSSTRSTVAVFVRRSRTATRYPVACDDSSTRLGGKARWEYSDRRPALSRPQLLRGGAPASPH